MPLSEEKYGQLRVDANNQERAVFWKDVKDIIILGLGSLENTRAVKFQLAFAMLLAEHLKGASISARDPAFTEIDKAVLRQLGCKVSAAVRYDIQRILPRKFVVKRCLGHSAFVKFHC